MGRVRELQPSLHPHFCIHSFLPFSSFPVNFPTAKYPPLASTEYVTGPANDLGPRVVGDFQQTRSQRKLCAQEKREILAFQSLTPDL